MGTVTSETVVMRLVCGVLINYTDVLYRMLVYSVLYVTTHNTLKSRT